MLRPLRIPLLAIVGLVVAVGLGISLSAAAPRPLTQKVFMRVKLASSQKLLEGLVTRDFDLIGHAAREMKDMSQQGQWPRAEDPVYTHYGEDFRRTCDQLIQLAEDENLEGASFAYFQVTSSCVTCHEYVRQNLRAADDPSNPFQLIPNWDKDEPLD